MQRWGEPRVTSDADLTILTGWGTEETFVDALLRNFRPRHESAREFALQNEFYCCTRRMACPFADVI